VSLVQAPELCAIMLTARPWRDLWPTDTHRSEISWIVSTQTFLTFGLSCFTGALFDKYGHRPLIATGTFCLVLGFCMLSLCTRYYQLMLVHASFLPIGCNLM
jgi:MFS family permease